MDRSIRYYVMATFARGEFRQQSFEFFGTKVFVDGFEFHGQDIKFVFDRLINTFDEEGKLILNAERHYNEDTVGVFFADEIEDAEEIEGLTDVEAAATANPTAYLESFKFDKLGYYLINFTTGDREFVKRFRLEQTHYGCRIVDMLEFEHKLRRCLDEIDR